MLFDPTHSWVPVALSQDLPAGTVMPARTHAGTVALWRSQSGQVAASADRCPHRGMRLSYGFVRGEALSCIYHGWSYGQTGHCLRIPAHPDLAPPETIRVATYRTHEAHGIIWVADGEPPAGPPPIDDAIPLRSLTFRAGRTAIAAAVGAKTVADELAWHQPGAPPMRLLFGMESEGETLVHILVPKDAGPTDQVTASRAAEALRLAAEHTHSSGAAS